MNLVCPKCKHEWNYKGNNRGAKCSKCKSWVKIKSSKNVVKGSGKGSSKSAVSIDFMSGSIVDTLKKIGLDPMKNGQMRDAILSILDKDENKIAFANAVEKTRKSPVKLVNKILVDWLKKGGYYD